MSNQLKQIFDLICNFDKITNFLYPILPFIYSLVTLLFIVLGIIGIIAFAVGGKFKNAARNIYGIIHLTTTLVNMLILFHITYCSLNIQTKPTTEVDDKGAERPPVDGFAENKIKQDGGGFGNSVKALLSKVFDVMNSVIENNSIPFIITHVLCSSIVVIVLTYMSSIFCGISKAGYQIHCSDSKEAFSAPWWGNLVDFFMHLLLIATSIFTVVYFFCKLIADGLSSVAQSFQSIVSTKPSKKSAVSRQELLDLTESSMPPDVSEVVSQVVMSMNEWPLMRVALIISLSYYISRLFLQGIEDIISNNIVLLATWQTRETECSDEPNKKSKTDIERGFVLFGNILFFIILVLLTIALVVINIKLFRDINPVLSKGIEMYTTTTATSLVPLSFDAVKKTIIKVGKGLPGGLDIDALENELKKALSNLQNSKGEIDIAALLQTSVQDSAGQTTKDHSDGAITKSEGVDHSDGAITQIRKQAPKAKTTESRLETMPTAAESAPTAEAPPPPLPGVGE